MSKSLVDIIATANPDWINGTRIDRTADGKWQVSCPSRFGARAYAVEINADLCIALRDAWGPYVEAELTAEELEG